MVIEASDGGEDDEAGKEGQEKTHEELPRSNRCIFFADCQPALSPCVVVHWYLDEYLDLCTDS